MMYNPQLDTFICVVEAGSFSKAAEELYISAPAVIKQINSLENSLNLQLFERTHRGLIITEAGKPLYQDAELYKLWKDRLESVLHDFAGFGWGMEEYICEEYYSLPWIQENNG